MPTSKNIRKAGTLARSALACALACALALPAAAFADTQLGLRVTDSSKSQGSSDPATGQPGSTQLGIRVTDSANPAPLEYTLAFATNGGSQVESQKVAYGAAATEPVAPTRDGYGFVAWYEAADLSGAPWDFSAPMPARDVTLYAKWTLRISCQVPASAAISIDASGTVTGASSSFVSSTVEPIVIAAVESERLAGAASVFANADTLEGVHVTLTPPVGSGSKVEVPLATAVGVPSAFSIPKLGAIEVSFDLALPPGALIDYAADAREVARLSYTVRAAS